MCSSCDVHNSWSLAPMDPMWSSCERKPEYPKENPSFRLYDDMKISHATLGIEPGRNCGRRALCIILKLIYMYQHCKKRFNSGNSWPSLIKSAYQLFLGIMCSKFVFKWIKIICFQNNFFFWGWGWGWEGVQNIWKYYSHGWKMLVSHEFNNTWVQYVLQLRNGCVCYLMN